MQEYISSLFLSKRLFQAFGTLVCLFVLGYFFPALFPVAKILFFVLVGLLALDIAMLYRFYEPFFLRRSVPERLSNGDNNKIRLYIENRYAFPIKLELVDEIPFQFQLRDVNFQLSLDKLAHREIEYLLRPTTRGEYSFGEVNAFISSPLQLVKRRFQFENPKTVPVYPSFMQMRQYEIMAISNRLSEVGVKKIRKLGQTNEFEQIKEYVQGDDYRTVNWKATARQKRLMVNQYTDEKAQHIYCLIDKSRVMKMPFEGMTLLDYSINSALVLSNIAILKHDKAGIIPFADKIQNIIPADNKPTQINQILQLLYHQTTTFPDADYERLYVLVKRKLTQRSLLVLFTNFESLTSMRRQLPYLRKLAQLHLVMVVFFENTEMHALIHSTPKNTEEIYVKTIAENFAFEKKQIVRELETNGIIAILTPPEKLTVNTINKYLEIKARGLM